MLDITMQRLARPVAAGALGLLGTAIAAAALAPGASAAPSPAPAQNGAPAQHGGPATTLPLPLPGGQHGGQHGGRPGDQHGQPGRPDQRGAFGPTSFRGVALGANLRQVQHAGDLRQKRGTRHCAAYTFRPSHDRRGFDVLISRKYGVANIVAPQDARTPRGIAVGSSLRDLRRAYPGLKGNDRHAWVYATPDKSAAYNFDLYRGRVSQVFLSQTHQDCWR
ncbi:hypothetical protein [Actinomadura parmotrematis]|uniref:Uncharacterized protein n=1 Tax=Actinomadura parmotrematis TaxID=2864039 RepID=A0ABS7FNG5_9ACTN|nr:hypothetical protein [Actinomadura parmotrematis]MBW8481924.1 hypothetical protein [Actinomadura parmotrematis]